VNRWTRLFALVVGATFAAQGLWAFLSPRSFFDVLATFEPYNAHFVRDIGAGMFGVGTAGVVAALHPRALVAGLAGLTAFQAVHVLGHVIDRDRGGNPGVDIPMFAVLAVVTAAALVSELRSDRGPDRSH
jgi:hypothetical protein